VKTSSSDNAVKMKVIQKRLRPGVKYQREANPGSEVFWPKRDLVKSFRYSSKGQVVGLLAIGKKERVKHIGHSKDDMMIFDWQQTLLLSLKPAHLLETLAFGAVTVAA
jgi:hypothetical protein